MSKRPRAADIVARLSGAVSSTTVAPKPELELEPKPAAKAPVPPVPKTTAEARAVAVPLLPTLRDHLAACASVVVAPDVAGGLVDRALSCGETFDAGELACPPVGFDGYSVLVHPAFVRAAARRGVAFYAGPTGKVRRFTITSDGQDSAPVAPPVPAVAEAGDFYLKPSWFADLAGFVDRGQPVLLIGPAGSGKSEAVERLFHERGQQLRIVSCTQRMTANDLEGATDLVIVDGHQITRFTPADPAIASKEGHGLLLDEADASPAEAMYAVYRLIDGKPMHILRKGVDSVIPRDDKFRVVGTQNTEGRGDDRGLYHGRSYQDEAFLDRWQNTILVTYPAKEDEVLILRKRTGVSAVHAERIVDAAQAFRNALKLNEIMMCCSLRRTLAVAGNVAVGMTPQAAWSFAVLNRAIPEDKDKLPETLRRIYGDKWRKRP